MPWGYAAAAVGTVVAGSMASDAAGNAADSQAQSAQASIDEQRREYDQTRADQAPFMQTGTAANSKLAYLLGLGGSASGQSGNSSAQINAGSLGNTSSGAWTPNSQLYANSPAYKSAWDAYMADHQSRYGIAPNNANGSDPAALQAELAARGFNINDYNTQAGQQATTNANDPAYGSLLKKFDQNDLNSDVVYNSGLQFGLDQGTGAINQRALQSGGYDSGGTLKALTKYANDYGSTKANDAYNRYNTDQSNVYNRLAGISGTGQTATNQVQAAGTGMANSVSNSIGDAGNARAAGIIGGANAWGSTASGLNNAYQSYNSNQTLQQLLQQKQPNYGANTNYVGDDPGGGYY